MSKSLRGCVKNGDGYGMDLFAQLLFSKDLIKTCLQEILNKNAWLGRKLVKVKKEIHLACSSNANIKNWSGLQARNDD